MLKTIALTLALILAACTPRPLTPFSTDAPMVLLPANQAGIRDDRARFRQIFCAVLEARRETAPDYRDCAEALTPVATETPIEARPVDLGPPRTEFLVGIVPGLGFSCFVDWLDLSDSVIEHIGGLGYEALLVPVGGLTTSRDNAQDIADWIEALSPAQSAKTLVLFGYSKGIADILEALVRHPDLTGRVTAVVSIAGAVGGSPLANVAAQWQADLLSAIPGAECERAGDHGAVEDLTTTVRERWLATNQLPASIRYYSLVTLPEPARISRGLRHSHRKLSQIDSRNDSQVIFYHQVIPRSTLLGYLNADHWAVAVPISRSQHLVAPALIDQNDYPREAMTEAIMRYLDESLAPAQREAAVASGAARR